MASLIFPRTPLLFSSISKDTISDDLTLSKVHVLVLVWKRTVPAENAALTLVNFEQRRANCEAGG